MLINVSMMNQNHMQKNLEANLTVDPWKNVTLNLASSPEVNTKDNKLFFKEAFKTIIEKNPQHILVTISDEQTRCFKWIKEIAPFKVYHVEGNNLILMGCFHKEQECRYPIYKSITLGITIVLFSEDLTLFLAVMEKSGPYRGWKAPTGGVDYGNEDEWTAAVRELKEETNVEIAQEQLKLVGLMPTNLKGRIPNRNFIFTAICDHNTCTLKSQESEIQKASWLSVSDFLSSKLPAKHENRPLVVQEVVKIALEAQKNGFGWQSFTAYRSAGGEALLYSQK